MSKLLKSHKAFPSYHIIYTFSIVFLSSSRFIYDSPIQQPWMHSVLMNSYTLLPSIVISLTWANSCHHSLAIKMISILQSQDVMPPSKWVTFSLSLLVRMKNSCFYNLTVSCVTKYMASFSTRWISLSVDTWLNKTESPYFHEAYLSGREENLTTK